jgi:plastocyanin
MRANLRASALVVAAFLIVGCGGSPAGTGSAPGTNPPAATAGASICTEPAAGTAADVEASVGGNEWSTVSAAVGDVITWTNGDAVPHRVALDDGSCAMSANITGGAPQSLVFNETGSFAFHCAVHPSMKGTITIS